MKFQQENRMLRAIVTHRVFERIVILVIVLNALTLGLETYPSIMQIYGTALSYIDKIFIAFFVVELTMRIGVFRGRFFSDGWNVFDFSIVVLTLLPLLGIPQLQSISAFRAVRLLRLLSVIPAFRRILRGIGRALSGSVAVMCVLGIIMYIFSVVSVKLFRNVSPEHFADLQTAFFTYFQIMTLDAWTDIVRPISLTYPWAAAFFICYIVTTVFILLSIIVGVAAEAIKHADDETAS